MPIVGTAGNRQIPDLITRDVLRLAVRETIRDTVQGTHVGQLDGIRTGLEAENRRDIAAVSRTGRVIEHEEVDSTSGSQSISAGTCDEGVGSTAGDE